MDLDRFGNQLKVVITAVVLAIRLDNQQVLESMAEFVPRLVFDILLEVIQYRLLFLVFLADCIPLLDLPKLQVVRSLAVAAYL